MARKEPQAELNAEEAAEKDLCERVFAACERYRKDRADKEREWTDSYAGYVCWRDRSKNPFLANLSIPKIHEAVEMVTAFLLGPNQAITVRPEEGAFNWVKAKVAEKWLDFLWRKRLDARLKLLAWVKQGVVFGNGVLKVGWDEGRKLPFLSNTAIEDVLFDYYEPDIQESEYVVHVVRRSVEEVRADKRYDAKDSEGNLIRESVIEDSEIADAALKFASYDRSPQPQDEGKAVLHEVWTRDEFMTLAPTGQGWRIVRRRKIPYSWRSNAGEGEKFRPFVKLRFKVSPLPNRAYDMGGVYPTVKLARAFEDLFNQYLSNVLLTNNAGWIKRKGASISARDLVRRPGQVVTVTDINADIKPMDAPTTKPDVLDMLNRLDSEFQQASMIVNLMKGIQSADLATEAVMGQENFYTLLRPLQDNIAEALSELGAMVLQISLDHAEGMRTLELFESDDEVGILSFDPSLISADYDVRVVPDRAAYLSKLVRQRQLMEFIGVMRGDPYIVQRYPDAPERLYRLWLDEAGFSGIDQIFSKAGQAAAVGIPALGTPVKGVPQGSVNPEAVMRSVTSPSLVGESARA